MATQTQRADLHGLSVGEQRGTHPIALERRMKADGRALGVKGEFPHVCAADRGRDPGLATGRIY